MASNEHNIEDTSDSEIREYLNVRKIYIHYYTQY